MILLNKADLVAEKEMAALEEVVRRMNPAARVLRTVSSKVALTEVVGTGAFHLDEIGFLQVRQHRFFYARCSEVMSCALGGITSINVNEHWFFKCILKNKSVLRWVVCDRCGLELSLVSSQLLPTPFRCRTRTSMMPGTRQSPLTVPGAAAAMAASMV